VLITATDINLEEAMKAKEDDQSALNVVLFQEIERYNRLLAGIRRSLSDVQKVCHQHVHFSVLVIIS
jgi:hypothetical protein